MKVIEIKYNDCVLDDIKVLGPANCSGLSSDEKTVLHGGNCTFGHLNGYTEIKLQTSPTVDRLTCINGHWSGTDFSVGMLMKIFFYEYYNRWPFKLISH